MKEANMNVLFDSNIIIDALSKRDDGNIGSSVLFLEAVKSRIIQGFLLTKQITDIYYVLRKYIKEDDVRKDFINLLLKAFNILETDPTDLLNSLSLDGKDYEDNILIYAATNNDIDCIVTNNKSDFKNSKIMIYTPQELTDILELM